MDIHDGSVESAWLSTNMCTVVGDYFGYLCWSCEMINVYSGSSFMGTPLPHQIYIISELWNTIFISYSYKESIMSQQTLKKNTLAIYQCWPMQNFTNSSKFLILQYRYLKNYSQGWFGISLIEGSTKSGGGTQGREVKMKSTKKKYMKGKGDQGGDSDEEEVSKSRGAEIQFMSVEEMVEELKQQPELRDCPEDFITEIATQIHRWGTI